MCALLGVATPNLAVLAQQQCLPEVDLDDCLAKGCLGSKFLQAFSEQEIGDINLSSPFAEELLFV